MSYYDPATDSYVVAETYESAVRKVRLPTIAVVTAGLAGWAAAEEVSMATAVLPGLFLGWWLSYLVAVFARGTDRIPGKDVELAEQLLAHQQSGGRDDRWYQQEAEALWSSLDAHQRATMQSLAEDYDAFIRMGLSSSSWQEGIDRTRATEALYRVARRR